MDRHFTHGLCKSGKGRGAAKVAVMVVASSMVGAVTTMMMCTKKSGRNEGGYTPQRPSEEINIGEQAKDMAHQ